MEELIARACAEEQIPVAEYHEALDDDALLGELHHRSIQEVLLGAVRPSRFD